jgi:hypothetical protein
MRAAQNAARILFQIFNWHGPPQSFRELPPLTARARNETIFGDSQGNGVSVNY